MTRDEFVTFARFVTVRSTILALFALLIGGVLYWRADSGPIGVFRESLVNAHQFSRATEAAVDSAVPVRVIAFDDEFCNRGFDGEFDASRQRDCIPPGNLNRADIAHVVGLAALARPRAIVLDFWPDSSQTSCDADSFALVHALLRAAQTAPVILSRAISPESELAGASDRAVRDTSQTFFDQCLTKLNDNELQRLRASEILFGHLELNRSSLSGLVNSVRPWIDAYVPVPTESESQLALTAPRPKLQQRVPSVSLIAAVAAKNSPERPTSSVLRSAGLETGWQPDRIAANTGLLNYCFDNEPDCGLQVRDLSRQPDKLVFAFSFHPAGQPARLGTTLPASGITSAALFNREASAALAESNNPPVIFIGSTAAAYGDLHLTAIGLLPGVVIHANALFAFLNDDFIYAPSPLKSALGDFLDILLFLLALAFTCLATVVISGAVKRRLGTEFDLRTSLALWWPISLVCLATLKVAFEWARMQSEFSNGVLSFSIVLVVIGLFDICTGSESLLKKRLEQWFGASAGAN